MDKQRSAPIDPEVWRKRAAYWNRIATRWVVLALCALATIVVTFLIAAGGHDTAVGRWFNSSMRITYGQNLNVAALILEDGSIELHTDGSDEMFDVSMDEFATEVNVFVDYRVRTHGFFGRTSTTRPLNFRFTAFDRDGHPATLSSDVRQKLSEKVVEFLCSSDSRNPGEPVADCPYFEILHSGQKDTSSAMVQNLQSYSDSYQLQHIRMRGYLHNIIALIAIVLLPYAVVQVIRTSARSRRWKQLAYDRTCPNCNYDIRNLPGPRCPECGTLFSSKR